MNATETTDATDATETIYLAVPIASELIDQHDRGTLEQVMAQGALNGLSKFLDGQRPTSPETASTRLRRRVAAIRKSRGLTQSDLADRCGLGRMTIVKAESGQRAISIDEAVLIAEALKIDVAQLLAPEKISLTINVD